MLKKDLGRIELNIIFIFKINVFLKNDYYVVIYIFKKLLLLNILVVINSAVFISYSYEK